MGLTGLDSRCWQVSVSSGVARGQSASSPFPAPRGCRHSWLRANLHQQGEQSGGSNLCLLRHVSLSALTPLSPSSIYKDSWLYWTHWIIQDNLPSQGQLIRNLNSICNRKLHPCQVTIYSRVSKVSMWISLFCLLVRIQVMFWNGEAHVWQDGMCILEGAFW